MGRKSDSPPLTSLFPISSAAVRGHCHTKSPSAQIFNANWTEAQWSYPPVADKAGFVGSVSYWEYSGQVAIYDASVDPNTTIAFPVTDLARSAIDDSDEQYWWFGGLADGSQIQPGGYV